MNHDRSSICRFAGAIDIKRTAGLRLVAWVVLPLGLLFGGQVTAQQIPALPEMTPAFAAAHRDLVRDRRALVMERDVLRESIRQHNERCGSVEENSAEHATCDISYAQLEPKVDHHIAASERFIRAFTIRAINALVERQNWDTKERKRLDRALKALKSDGDLSATGVMIRQAWRDILARGEDEDLARSASSGKGPGLPGAGTQTNFQDCAIFAVANAAGLPYSVVATRATQFIREGEWRTPAERANPQDTIEQRGMIGEEVVLLAEAFGQVEVVNGKNFAKVLKQGHPVMVNVVPADGDVGAGHQIVLTRTFQHKGGTWYEMMDSNQGPVRRLYLSARELEILQQENGVVYRPERGSTPVLLR